MVHECHKFYASARKNHPIGIKVRETYKLDITVKSTECTLSTFKPITCLAPATMKHSALEQHHRKKKKTLREYCYFNVLNFSCSDLKIYTNSFLCACMCAFHNFFFHTKIKFYSLHCNSKHLKLVIAWFIHQDSKNVISAADQEHNKHYQANSTGVPIFW